MIQECINGIFSCTQVSIFVVFLITWHDRWLSALSFIWKLGDHGYATSH